MEIVTSGLILLERENFFLCFPHLHLNNIHSFSIINDEMTHTKSPKQKQWEPPTQQWLKFSFFKMLQSNAFRRIRMSRWCKLCLVLIPEICLQCYRVTLKNDTKIIVRIRYLLLIRGERRGLSAERSTMGDTLVLWVRELHFRRYTRPAVRDFFNPLLTGVSGKGLLMAGRESLSTFFFLGAPGGARGLQGGVIKFVLISVSLSMMTASSSFLCWLKFTFHFLYFFITEVNWKL